jgi:hypothetical protein
MVLMVRLNKTEYQVFSDSSWLNVEKSLSVTIQIAAMVYLATVRSITIPYHRIAKSIM